MRSGFGPTTSRLAAHHAGHAAAMERGVASAPRERAATVQSESPGRTSVGAGLASRRAGGTSDGPAVDAGAGPGVEPAWDDPRADPRAGRAVDAGLGAFVGAVAGVRSAAPGQSRTSPDAAPEGVDPAGPGALSAIAAPGAASRAEIPKVVASRRRRAHGAHARVTDAAVRPVAPGRAADTASRQIRTSHAVQAQASSAAAAATGAAGSCDGPARAASAAAGLGPHLASSPTERPPRDIATQAAAPATAPAGAPSAFAPAAAKEAVCGRGSALRMM